MLILCHCMCKTCCDHCASTLSICTDQGICSLIAQCSAWWILNSASWSENIAHCQGYKTSCVMVFYAFWPENFAFYISTISYVFSPNHELQIVKGWENDIETSGSATRTWYKCIDMQVHRKFPPLHWRARLPSVNILWPRGTQTCSRRQREGNQPDKTDFQKYIARQPTDHPDIKEGDVGNTRGALSDPTWNK